MASQSLQRWQGMRAAILTAIDATCAVAAGRQPPDPVLEFTLVRSYTVLLAAQFQGYCRDLYSECVTAVVRAVPTAMQTLVREQCGTACQLTGANARYESLRTDFERFDLSLMDELKVHDPAAATRVTPLNHLNQWRNYVAHSNPLPPAHGGPLTLATVRQWRTNCERLADGMDAVMYDHLTDRLGSAPW